MWHSFLPPLTRSMEAWKTLPLKDSESVTLTSIIPKVLMKNAPLIFTHHTVAQRELPIKMSETTLVFTVSKRLFSEPKVPILDFDQVPILHLRQDRNLSHFAFSVSRRF